MNFKRLLNIAQEADKIGDYVTADKVTNLLKTAQGQYSGYPNQNSQVNTNIASSDQQYNTLSNQYLTNIISNAHAWNSAMAKVKSYGAPGTAGYNQQEIDKLYASMNTITENNKNVFEAIKQDKRLTEVQKGQMNAQGSVAMSNVNAKYESGQLQQTPGLQISGGPGTAAIPMASQQAQQTQQMPQQGGVYNPGMAPGATYYTPGVVNVAQPQMTDEQKAFAKLRGTGIYQSLSKSNGVMDQRLQAIEDAENKARQSRIYYGPAAGQANPNASINPNLYGTGYASMAMNPQLQPQPPYNPQQQLQQQPQQQPEQIASFSPAATAQLPGRFCLASHKPNKINSLPTPN